VEKGDVGDEKDSMGGIEGGGKESKEGGRYSSEERESPEEKTGRLRIAGGGEGAGRGR
jgi:hypothetical protein